MSSVCLNVCAACNNKCKRIFTFWNYVGDYKYARGYLAVCYFYFFYIRYIS
nr:MAG TPA: hypothetical protein [Bacteriophage sp.]